MQPVRQPTRHIGTRGSPLALYQAEWVQRLLRDRDPETDWQLRILKTSGDTIEGELKDFGGKGLFTRELEEALLDGRIDLAVHSMKDVPTVGHERLVIPALLPRADVRDAFISVQHASIDALPEGALVGSASLRRRAQLAARRPDVRFCLLRGNVQTRLRKLEEGVCDATFLAVAGLDRLGASDRITQAVPTDVMLPAPAQGVVGIEIRREDQRMRDMLAGLNDKRAELSITAERAFLRALDGSCRTPIAALAEWNGSTLQFRGEVLSTDGALRFGCADARTIETVGEAYDFGFVHGEVLRSDIGGRITFDI
ncbi:hydroxymethylbilane synthase [Algimonas porphyrae]|uniref:Porphobilinogen deaminase n=1 Tax=Algimonas porphyrae TaxID=1128113 RepID=A0ABQ5UZ81_9PROT|nr:hydroxymethylbilane synthase [Algimonas porphyrae]GLQ20157.1 porphobilinogen deaminase [Algimonas porphyrae]